MFVVGGSAALADNSVEYSFRGGAKTYGPDENGITISCSLLYSQGANIYGGSFITITSENPITRVELTDCSASGYGISSGFGAYIVESSGKGKMTNNGESATWTTTGTETSVSFTTSNDFCVGRVEVFYEGEDDGSVKSTLNFASTAWNLSVNGETAVPTSGCHFDTRDVFTNADGVTMTLTNVASRGEGGLDSERKGTGYAQSWPNECYYSQYINGYYAMYFCNGEGFTITAPSGYTLNKIVVNRPSNNSQYPMTSLIMDGVQNTGTASGTWEGEAESVEFSTISGDATKRILVSNIQVTLMPILEEGEITYTIDLVNAPDGAYVTLDEQRFEDDGTYTIEKNFGKNDLEAYEPEGYYAEVEYTRDSHTYTVTYYAYNYYDVTVTGTSDANAGVVYGGHTYGNGDRIESKDVLNLGSVETAELDGMESEVSFADNRYTVAYTKLAYIRFDFKTGYSFNKGGIQASSSNTYPNSTKGTNIYSNYRITVTAESPIEKIVFNGLQGYNSSNTHNVAVITGGGSWKDNNNSTSPATWVAGANCTNVVFGSNDGSDMYIASIDVYLKTVEPINYTIEFVNAPDEAYITLDGETINKVNSGYTVAKELNVESVTYAYEPAGYYADVTYDEENHKFTVTYVEGGRVEFGTEFSGQTVTTDGITYDRGWSGGELYQTSYSGYGRIYVKSETKSIKKVEIACNGSASPVIEEFGVGSMAASGNTAVWTAPEEGVVQDLTFYSTSGSSLAVSKVTVFYSELPNIDYPVVIAVDGDLPADFTPTVTVDGQNFTENGTYSTPKPLTKANVSATLPENGDWYYDVDYAEATNTFTVTYKEYLHYIVSVVGCEDETAGVRNGSNTFHNGEKINVKEALTAEALTAVTVNGYDVEAPEVGEGTVTVTYAVAGLVDYAVTITGMPAGASVKIEDQVFDENTDNGVHQSNKTLSSSVVTIQNCPETHYTNESSEWFDAEGKAFNIAFTPYLVYTVAVDEASAYQGGEAGVKVFNANTYLPGQTIYNKTALTESDVKATDVDGYTGTVTLADNVFTVSYVKDAFIKFDASAIAGSGSVNETKDGVTLQCWDNGDEFTVGEQTNYSYVITSTGAPIVKVEIDYKWPDGDHLDYCNTGSLNADLTVWTGSTNELRLKNSNNWGIDVNSLKVYLAQPIDYTINITGMPEGDDNYYVVANNDVKDGKFTTNGRHTYTTTDELNENSVNCAYPINPQTYKVDVTYNAETKTYDVTYTALTQYNVEADGDNAYTGDRYVVRVNDAVNYKIGDTFYLDGTLEDSNISLITQDGYTGSFVLDNDADPKTITVKYVEKPAETYTVVFAGEVPEGASVTITDASGNRTISNEDADKTFQSRYTYTDASAKAKAFEYYDAIVALDGTTFTVTYSKLDYIYVDLTTDEADRTKVTSKSTAETVSVNFTAWDGMAEMCSGWPITVTSATYNIAKIEYVYDHGYKNSGTSVSAGAWTTEFEVWEAGSSKTKSVVYDASYSGSDVYYTAVKVYLDTDPVGHFAMSAAGWATLCVNDDFTLPAGYTAYTAGKVVEGAATLVEDDKIVYTEIDRVPAGTPVIISGPENANVELLATYGAVAPEVNYLYGNPYDVAMDFYAATIADQGLGELDYDTWEYTYGFFGPCQLYQLAKENGVLGFYRQVENGATLKCGAHKAFLVVPDAAASSNARFILPGQEDATPTGIESVVPDSNDAIYNLQGQRVNATKAGVYVKNGRKIIVK